MALNQEEDRKPKGSSNDNEDHAMSSSVDPGAIERQMVQDDQHTGSLASGSNGGVPPSGEAEQAQQHSKLQAKPVGATSSMRTCPVGI